MPFPTPRNVSGIEDSVGVDQHLGHTHLMTAQPGLIMTAILDGSNCPGGAHGLVEGLAGCVLSD